MTCDVATALVVLLSIALATLIGGAAIIAAKRRTDRTYQPRAGDSPRGGQKGS